MGAYKLIFVALKSVNRNPVTLVLSTWVMRFLYHLVNLANFKGKSHFWSSCKYFYKRT